MKTMKDYYNSDAYYFDEFFKVGDVVGEDVVSEFRNCLPPTTNTSYLMQMGEPVSHIEGKATYMTFENTPEGWKYKGNCFRGETETPFNKWLNTFLDEKGIDLSEEFESEKNGIKMTFSYQDVVDNIKTAPEEEQEQIKNTLVKMDFNNLDCLDFLRHLSKALIPTKEQVEELEDTFGESINLTKEDDEEEI